MLSASQPDPGFELSIDRTEAEKPGRQAVKLAALRSLQRERSWDAVRANGRATLLLRYITMSDCTRTGLLL